MKRARAAQLALVNWKGVFYERYELNDSVTALEGANGAGKTTVLIAVFVTLLPDMNHLRFTNVGEHGGAGGDRGIWGRLGETGKPSYTVLDIELANGDRFLAGVHLERRSEPSVEPTPFLITDLPRDTSLQELLLVRGEDVDAIPELEEIRQRAALHGAKLQRCATAREYFAALFDRGVTPLRLEGDSERAKLAEMLRTSMTGGMSRVLTTGLRAFLLKEERGLAETLRRMRSNMNACRRTRTEVEEARQLEGEISGVFEAGQEMFSAAVHASQEAAQEAARRTEESEQRRRAAADSVTKAQGRLKSVTQERDRASGKLRDLEAARDEQRERVRRLEEGRTLQRAVEAMQAEVEAECRTKNWRLDVSSGEESEQLREKLQAQRDQAHDQARKCEDAHRKLEAERTVLFEHGGNVSEELSALSRELDGELLAKRFEDVSIEEAGVQEARLGPLTNAIVVNDLESAAQKVLRTENRPGSVWLLNPDAVPRSDAARDQTGRVVGNDVIVRMNEGVGRVSRVPDRPVLGRRARGRKLEELRHECDREAKEAEQHRRRQKEIEMELRSFDELLSKVRRIEVERAKLTQFGIPDMTETAVAQASASLKEHEAQVREADRSSRELERSLGTRTTELEHARSRLASAEEAVRQDRAVSEPANRRWEALNADAGDLIAPAFGAEVTERLEGRGSVNLNRDALTWAGRLQERLARADGGDERAQAMSELCAQEDRSGEDYLRAWREVRQWLHRRVPAQIAQMDDPLEALSRLRGYLAELEKHLKRQERDLQGDSAGVATAIGTQIRQARSGIGRLNHDLQSVRFGSIEAVRLQLRGVPEMENILDALRNADAQRGIFSPDVPLEDALDELFKRHAGRRNQGQRLLDYREYVDPRVEVRRKARGAWETANPQRISTGESIGIGAALMMVVLTAWERNASLLRAQRASGTLRMLLLDEANRLDRGNLGVLFDLCQNLNLQLLVAAPEVAQAEGNTTYRLTRVVDEDGREEVRVSGRRMVAGEAA